MDKRSLMFVVVLTVGLFFVNNWFHSKDQERKTSTTATQAVASIETTTPAPTPAPVMTTESSGSLYVLENEFQQVVFSSVGGSIAEINLPFQSSENKKSLVLPIGFDRSMEKDYPYNAYFPSESFYKVQNGQIQKEHQGSLGGYYPLLRRRYLRIGEKFPEINSTSGIPVVSQRPLASPSTFTSSSRQ